jgi:cellulose biosynthesis protein BcsQ
MTMGKVITVANRKGGVGKTTLVVALAHALTADEGKSVCVIDTDPQASATIALIGVDRALAHSTKHLGALLTGGRLSRGRVRAADCVIGQVSHLTNKPDVPLALIPCSPDFWRIEDRLRARQIMLPNPRAEVRRRLARLMMALRSSYDFILIDTPPGRTFLSDFVAKDADLVLVPSNPTPVALWGLDIYEGELNRLGVHHKARWLWTLTDGRERWQDQIRGFLERSHVRAITKPQGGPEGTDINDPIPFPRLSGFATAFEEREPKTFARFYGNNESVRVSELARYVMHAVEEISP